MLASFVNKSGIKNIVFNPSHSSIQSVLKKIQQNPNAADEELVYVGAKIKTIVYYADYSADVVDEFATHLTEISFKQIAASI